MLKKQRVENLSLEIEVYVGEDGSQVGLSQTALSKLCGFESSRNLFAEGRLGWKLDKGDSDLPESLLPYAGDIYIDIPAQYNSRIIKSKVAAALIAHVATSPKTTPERQKIARASLMAFSEIGIDRWIKRMAGVADSNESCAVNTNQGSTNDALRELLLWKSEVESKLKIFSRGFKTYERLEHILPGNAKSKALPPASKDGYFTLREFLDNENAELSREQMHLYANLVADSYRVITGKSPEKKFRYRDGRSIGKYLVYEPEHFELLKECLSNVLESSHPPVQTKLKQSKRELLPVNG